MRKTMHNVHEEMNTDNSGHVCSPSVHWCAPAPSQFEARAQRSECRCIESNSKKTYTINRTMRTVRQVFELHFKGHTFRPSRMFITESILPQNWQFFSVLER